MLDWKCERGEFVVGIPIRCAECIRFGLVWFGLLGWGFCFRAGAVL